VASPPAVRDRAACPRLRGDKSRTRARAADRCRRADREGGLAMAIAESRDTSVIESVDRIRAADPGDMLGRIKDLPKQIRDAWAIASQAALPPAYGDVRSITVAGMRGSAIGGDLAAALLADELKGPMAVHRDYRLPGYLARDSRVVAPSS